MLQLLFGLGIVHHMHVHMLSQSNNCINFCQYRSSSIHQFWYLCQSRDFCDHYPFNKIFDRPPATRFGQRWPEIYRHLIKVHMYMYTFIFFIFLCHYFLFY